MTTRTTSADTTARCRRKTNGRRRQRFSGAPRKGAADRCHRQGFTLVELLIVMAIMLIILSMTVATFSYVSESDRVSSEASRIQSFIQGARDRAIYSDELRGVRLFVEPPPPGTPPGASAYSRTVTSLAYIAPGGTWNAPEHSANIDILRIDGNILNDPTPPGGVPAADGDFEDPEDLLIKVRGQNNPGWWNLKRRGWLVDGLRIRIPAGPSGQWYTINTQLIDVTTAPTSDQYLILDVPYADGGNKGQEIAWESLTYEIELPPRILPNEPVLLAESVVIDLDGSDIPNIWRPGPATGSQYSGYMDIWFSPRGNLIGEAAAKGVLHFYVCDREDSTFLKEQLVEAVGLPAFDTAVAAGVPFIPLDEIDPATVGWLPLEEKYFVKDRRLVTVFSQTGSVSVSKVHAYSEDTNNNGTLDPGEDVNQNGVLDVADSDNNGLVDDPYYYAETGEVAQ